MCFLCGVSSVVTIDKASGSSVISAQSDDWQLLSFCEQSLGNIPKSVEALAMAATIDPRLERAHALLAPYYRQRGDLQRAAWHQRRALGAAP